MTYAKTYTEKQFLHQLEEFQSKIRTELSFEERKLLGDSLRVLNMCLRTITTHNKQMNEEVLDEETTTKLRAARQELMAMMATEEMEMIWIFYAFTPEEESLHWFALYRLRQHLLSHAQERFHMG